MTHSRAQGRDIPSSVDESASSGLRTVRIAGRRLKDILKRAELQHPARRLRPISRRDDGHAGAARVSERRSGSREIEEGEAGKVVRLRFADSLDAASSQDGRQDLAIDDKEVDEGAEEEETEEDLEGDAKPAPLFLLHSFAFGGLPGRQV